jgi:hypothetical protein
MPIDFLKGYMTDRIEDSVTEGRRGNYKPGFMESAVGGFLGLDGQGIADDLKESDDNKAGLKALKATGRSREQLNLSPGAMLTPEMVQGANANFNESERERLRGQNKTDKLETISANNAVGMAGVNATREGTNAQLEMARMENASRDKRYYADRIDAREARADELMFRRESMERADRKDEKNRRRESIQALVAGLSSLGAAFAV